MYKQDTHEVDFDGYMGRGRVRIITLSESHCVLLLHVVGSSTMCKVGQPPDVGGMPKERLRML